MRLVEAELTSSISNISSKVVSINDHLNTAGADTWLDLRSDRLGAAGARKRVHVEQQLCLAACSKFMAVALHMLKSLEESILEPAGSSTIHQPSSQSAVTEAPFDRHAFLNLWRFTAFMSRFFGALVGVVAVQTRPPPTAFLKRDGAITSWLLAFLRNGSPALRALKRDQTTWHTDIVHLLNPVVAHLTTLSHLPLAELSAALKDLPTDTITTLCCVIYQFSPPHSAESPRAGSSAQHFELLTTVLNIFKRIHLTCFTAKTPLYPEFLSSAVVEVVKLDVLRHISNGIEFAHACQTLAFVLDQLERRSALSKTHDSLPQSLGGRMGGCSDSHRAAATSSNSRSKDVSGRD